MLYSWEHYYTLYMHNCAVTVCVALSNRLAVTLVIFILDNTNANSFAKDGSPQFGLWTVAEYLPVSCSQFPDFLAYKWIKLPHLSYTC